MESNQLRHMQSNGIGPSEAKRCFKPAELQPHMHCPLGAIPKPPRARRTGPGSR